MGNAQAGSGQATHKVTVKTKDSLGEDSDNGKVYAKISDGGEKWTDEYLVSELWSFKPESTGEFQVTAPDHGKITDICIRRDSDAAAWFLEKVEIEHISSGKKSVFPVTRYLDPKDELYVSEFDSSLPQFSSYSEQRQAELLKTRAAYKLAEIVPGLPYQLDGPLPRDQHRSTSGKGDKATGAAPDTNSKFTSVEELDGLYKALGMETPKGKETWKDEVEFGNLRLCGLNSKLIQLCQEHIPEGFAVTVDMVKPFLEGKTLAEAMVKKKIYIVDLRYLAGLEIETDDGLSSVPGPIGMFYVKDNDDMVCIAIQLMPEPAADNPVFLPSDPPYTWQLAKMWFNLADASHHWSNIHLGFCHLMMEGVVVTMHRSLPKSHPVYRLMAPHIFNILAINVPVKGLVQAPGPFLNHVMLMKQRGVQKIIAHNWSEWTLKGIGHFKHHLQNRGVDDPHALPNYHYRDDGLLIWDAERKYVKAIIDGVYDEPSKLAGDWELQSWATRLADANFKGVPCKFQTNDELIEFITAMIFTASVEHAAANFASYDQYGYAPNYPIKMWGDHPKDKNERTMDDIVSSVQGKSEIIQLLGLVKLLAMRGPEKLGYFEHMQYAYDSTSLNALEKLREELKGVEKTIEERNAVRSRKYTDLRPSDVPNAISS